MYVVWPICFSRGLIEKFPLDKKFDVFCTMRYFSEWLNEDDSFHGDYDDVDDCNDEDVDRDRVIFVEAKMLMDMTWWQLKRWWFGAESEYNDDDGSQAGDDNDGKLLTAVPLSWMQHTIDFHRMDQVHFIIWFSYIVNINWKQ